jgi:putative transposase
MQTTPTDYPERKRLPHTTPNWVPDDSRYFITINCAIRDLNQLSIGRIAQALMDSIPIYERSGKWWMHLMTIMPDHLHFIASFGKTHAMAATIKQWKSFHARKSQIQWQSGFFEHRLRDDRAFIEKAHYVRMNPVRKGLVQQWQDWPYTFSQGIWTDQSPPA